MNDFENKITFDDDDFLDDEDINYQSYSSEIKGRKKPPISTILLAVLFVIVVVLVIIVVKNSIGDSDDNSDNDSTTTTTTQSQTTLPPSFSADKIAEVTVTDDKKLVDSNNKPIKNVLKDTLALINSEHEYRYDTNQGGLESLYGKGGPYNLSTSDLSLTRDTRLALNAWVGDFHNAVNINENVLILQAFYADPDGHNEHQSGLCVNMKMWDGVATSQIKDKDEYKWLLDNAYKYGFIQRYPDGKSDITGVANEPDHFRYIGVAHSTAMKQNNINCFETYIDHLKKFTFWGEHLYVTCENGDKYEIYFSASNTITVPTDREYTISGNNVDGFIVTIKN